MVDIFKTVLLIVIGMLTGSVSITWAKVFARKQGLPEAKMGYVDLVVILCWVIALTITLLFLRAVTGTRS